MEGEGNAYCKFYPGGAFLWFMVPVHNDYSKILSTYTKPCYVYPAAGNFFAWSVLDKVVGDYSCQIVLE